MTDIEVTTCGGGSNCIVQITQSNPHRQMAIRNPVKIGDQAWRDLLQGARSGTNVSIEFIDRNRDHLVFGVYSGALVACRLSRDLDLDMGSRIDFTPESTIIILERIVELL